MRLARINLPGRSAPLQAAVTADGAALDLGGRRIPIPKDGFAPAVDGWIYGPLLNDRPSWERLAPQMTEKPYVEPPTVPVLYFKPANTHLGHGGTVRLPAYADRVELGATIGMVMRQAIGQASEETAMAAVGGFTIVLDLSVPNDSVYRPPVQEKCFDTACPVGPWVVDASKIPDPTRLTVRTLVNGKQVAERRFDDLIRSPARLITDVTAFMTLSAGDTLTLGHGVGLVPTAGRGDTVRVEIEGLGTLECILGEDRS